MDIKIYEEVLDNEHAQKCGYNIGDLLNMPSFWAKWGRNPHSNENYYNDQYKLSCQHYTESILSYYDKLRIDETEPIPNIPHIREAVYEYGKKVSCLRSMCDKTKIIDPSTLCIHIRSGDKGIIEPEFIQTILDISKSYDTLIIMSGIHADQRTQSFESSKDALLHSIGIIQDFILDKTIIIDLSCADLHIWYMSQAKNLLIHKGGFSQIGGLVFSGDHLYITSLLETHNSEEYLQYLMVTPIIS